MADIVNGKYGGFEDVICVKQEVRSGQYIREWFIVSISVCTVHSTQQMHSLLTRKYNTSFLTLSFRCFKILFLILIKNMDHWSTCRLKKIVPSIGY